MSTYIASIDALDVKGRCEIASVSLVHDEPGYEPEVLLPDDEWGPLAAKQVTSLRPPADATGNMLHEIIRLPVGSDELARIRESSTEYSLNHSQTINFDPFAGGHASTFIGHVDSPGGQRTTTVDQRFGKHNGIHLDNFDQLPISERANSRRRLAVNLGPGHRFLILATKDVWDVTAGNQILDDYPRTADVREFVRRGGALNCVRIRIEPGEGYVAPTEVVPHDGSTSGIGVSSRIAFWLGRWPAGVLPSAIS
ncbi:MAG TPA: hypothetical protein VGS97_19005 [Actinocrinis sp.]|uniref:hypothetical protein n=1 Tax=Actinocrinis sp. TaxID=1920516 RepID=UPI002DDCF9DB|nr:hypothetical protein [Actinocrinis sp.]HEV2346196.1 hypothetical protein [Actinocrinis sp.]